MVAGASDNRWTCLPPGQLLSDNQFHRFLTKFLVYLPRGITFHTVTPPSLYFTLTLVVRFPSTQLTVGVVIYIINTSHRCLKIFNIHHALDIFHFGGYFRGFALIGTFYDKSSSKNKTSLRRSGSILLAAALFFTILFFLLQM